MVAIEPEIPVALFTALEAFAAAHSPVLLVAYPDVPFEPVDGVAYLEATFLPNVTEPFAIAGASQYQGLLQVAVMQPAGDGALIPAMRLAGEVLDHFPKDSTFESDGVQVCVNRRGSIAAPLQEPDRLRLPVTITYQLFH